MLTGEIKICTCCKTEKPIDEFWRRDPRCKECGSVYNHRKYREDKEKTSAKYRLDYLNNPLKYRAKNIKHRYRISLDAFDAIFISQGCKCACCGCTEPGGRHNQWMLDHNHKCCSGDSGRLCGKCNRGILCAACNFMLGHSGDDEDRLLYGAAYLRRWSRGSS